MFLIASVLYKLYYMNYVSKMLSIRILYPVFHIRLNEIIIFVLLIIAITQVTLRVIQVKIRGEIIRLTMIFLFSYKQNF